MMGKKKDKEYGSAANLIDNAEKVAALGRGNSTMSDKRKNFSRTQSRTSEFETVKIHIFDFFFKILNNLMIFFIIFKLTIYFQNSNLTIFLTKF